MGVGVMTVAVMSVGEITVGVMTVGVMTVGVMRRPRNKTSARELSLSAPASTIEMRLCFPSLIAL
jgi:hypothetical protein